MNIKKGSLVLGLALALPLTADLKTAYAQVVVTTPSAVVFLNPVTPNSGGPGMYTFTGAILNVSTTTLFLNGDQITPVSPTNALPSWLTFDDTPFLTNTPSSLDALGGSTSSYTGGLFNLTVAANAVPGTYQFTYDVLGGTNGLAEDILASTDPFTITIAAAPEPSSPTIIGAGMLGIIGLYSASRLRARRRG